jgi:hypothetical protein
MVISVKAAWNVNTLLLDDVTSEVALEEAEFGSTDPNILMDNNCIDDELNFGIPGDSRDYEDEGNGWDECNAIPTASWRRRPTTKLNRYYL